MPTSDDANARRAELYDRNQALDPRHPRDAAQDRTWSQSQRDLRQPPRPPVAAPSPPPRQPAFSGHTPPSRYPDPEPVQQQYSRHDYPPPLADHAGRDAGWETPPQRFQQEAAYDQRGHGHALPPEPQRGYPGHGYEPETLLYPGYDPVSDNPYGAGGAQPSPQTAHRGFGNDSLYDNYGQAAGAPAVDPYERQHRDTPQLAAPRAYQQQPAQPHQDVYERTLGARIARDATPSRFFLPEEQPGQSFHQPAGQQHEQLYDPNDFEPQHSDVAPAAQAYSDPGFDPRHDDAQHWGLEQPEPLGDVYRGGVPATARNQGDELDADFFSDEDDFEHDDAHVPPRKGRKKLIAAVLVGAVAIGGGSAYVYKTVISGGTSDSTGAPVIRADAGATKATPSNPGGRQFSGGEKTIYDRLTPEGPTSGRPSDPSAMLATASTSSSPAAAQAPATPPASGAGSTLEDRIEEALRKAQRSGEGAPAPEAARSGPDQPIVVRSETYRPDGTRLEAQGAARPQGTARSVMDTTSLPPPFGPGPGGASASPTVTTPATAYTSGIVTTRPPERVAAPPAVQPQPAPRPAPETRTAALAAPAAPARPAAVAATQAAAPSAPVRPAALAGGHFVQMRASNDERRALSEINELNEKYGVVLGGVQISSRAVDLGEKGVWFRLMAGPLPSKDSATELCNKLKGAGLQGCLVRSE